MRRTFLAAAVASLLAAAGHAGAVVIDFNALVGSGDVNRGSSYNEDGFNLTRPPTTPASQFRSTHQGTFRWAGPPGNVHFYNNPFPSPTVTVPTSVTVLTQIGGGAFDLDSIDLAELNRCTPTPCINPGDVVTFIGDLFGGGTTSQTFTLDGSANPAFQTFLFNSSFNNVTAVRWEQDAPFHQFDNIVVNQVIPAPEPPALALLVVGLAALGFARRRREK